MAAFALRWSATAVSPLTYNPAAANQVSYEALEFYLPKTVVESVAGVTKRGRRYQHTKYVLKDYRLVIGSDEIDDAEAFLRAFWSAPYKYISNGASDNYEQVVTEGGAFPVSYDDDEIFPEVSFVLFCVEPE